MLHNAEADHPTAQIVADAIRECVERVRYFAQFTDEQAAAAAHKWAETALRLETLREAL